MHEPHNFWVSHLNCSFAHFYSNQFSFILGSIFWSLLSCFLSEISILGFWLWSHDLFLIFHSSFSITYCLLINASSCLLCYVIAICVPTSLYIFFLPAQTPRPSSQLFLCSIGTHLLLSDRILNPRSLTVHIFCLYPQNVSYYQNSQHGKLSPNNVYWCWHTFTQSWFPASTGSHTHVHASVSLMHPTALPILHPSSARFCLESTPFFLGDDHVYLSGTLGNTCSTFCSSC
jgi:hypothetical protein